MRNLSHVRDIVGKLSCSLIWGEVDRGDAPVDRPIQMSKAVVPLEEGVKQFQIYTNDDVVCFIHNIKRGCVALMFFFLHTHFLLNFDFYSTLNFN